MKKLIMTAMILCMAVTAHLSVLAAPSYRLNDEDTEEGVLHTLTFAQRYDGRITESDLSTEMEYEGIVYELYEVEFSYQYGSYAQEKDGDIRIETYALPNGETAEIPKYIDDGDTVYVLNEESIVVTPTEYGQASGADAVYTTVEMQDLPDNDMDRIPVTVKKDGHEWELLYVDYTPASYDAYGAPSEYNAVCTYGRLSDYSVTHETAWEATVQYQGYQASNYVTATDAVITYAYLEAAEEEPEVIQETPIETEVPATEPDVILEEPEKPGIPTAVVIGTTAAAGGGIFILALYFFLTVPLYAMTAKGKYRRIGRIRLQKDKEYYAANISEQAVRKAQVPSFMIRVPGKVKRVMKINSQDGTNLVPVINHKVTFGLNNQ